MLAAGRLGLARVRGAIGRGGSACCVGLRRPADARWPFATSPRRPRPAGAPWSSQRRPSTSASGHIRCARATRWRASPRSAVRGRAVAAARSACARARSAAPSAQRSLQPRAHPNPERTRPADKRHSAPRPAGFSIQQITSINHDVNPDKVRGSCVRGSARRRRAASDAAAAAQRSAAVGAACNRASAAERDSRRPPCSRGFSGALPLLLSSARLPPDQIRSDHRLLMQPPTRLLAPRQVGPGQTILLPGSSLSSRDKEILEGIGSVYR